LGFSSLQVCSFKECTLDLSERFSVRTGNMETESRETDLFLQIIYKVLSFPHKMLTKLFRVIKGYEVSEYEEHYLVACDTV
jgi:hypothetical protein